MARAGVGIDIGTKGVTVAQIERRGGELALTAALRLSRPAQPEEYAVEAETAEDLAANLKGGGIPVAGAVLGLSGRDLILRYTQVPPVPDWRLKMLMEFEIGELAGKSGGDVASDYQVLEVPEDSGGNRTAVVGLAKVEGLDARLGSLTGAGLVAPDACPASLGLYHAVVAADIAQPDETLMVLDIGARNTEMVITKGDTLLFARNLSNGGDQFTQAIADACSESFADAETIKHKQGDVAPMRAMRAKDARHEAILSSVSGAASQYAAMLQSSLMFAKAQTRMAELQPDRVLVSGGGSRLKGLKDFLRNALKVPVDTFDPLKSMDVQLGDPDLEEAIGGLGREMAVAVGLARISLGEPGPRLTLLPPRVLRRREFFQQKLFLWGGGVAAAFFFLLGLVGAIRDVNAVEANLKVVKASEKQANKFGKEISAVRNQTKVHLLLQQALAREIAPGQAFVKLLAGIQASAPANLYVEKLEMRPDAVHMGSGSTVKMEGRITQGDDPPQSVLSRFIGKLAALPGGQSADGKPQKLLRTVVQSKKDTVRAVLIFELDIEFEGLAGPRKKPVDSDADEEDE